MNHDFRCNCLITSAIDIIGDKWTLVIIKQMLLEGKKTFKDFSVEKDPANNCLDVAIITDPKLRTKKTINKLKHIAGRVLLKK